MQANPHVSAGSATFGNDLPLALIAGPCAMESRAHALEMASALKEICARIGMPLVYKSSFDKANRTSLASARGLGMARGLEAMAEIKASLGLPVITDVHDASQCAPVAEVVDILQIPAFLCRQSDLLLAAAATGRAVNIKKGQFLAPWDMKNVVAKLTGAGRVAHRRRRPGAGGSLPGRGGGGAWRRAGGRAGGGVRGGAAVPARLAFAAARCYRIPL